MGCKLRIKIPLPLILEMFAHKMQSQQVIGERQGRTANKQGLVLKPT